MPFDIVSVVVGCGNGIFNAAYTLVSFNYKIVTGLLSLASDTYKILATLTLNLFTACRDICFYLWEIVCEIIYLGDALWNAFEKICILIAHVGFVLWNGLEASAECIATCILSGLKLSYHCVQKMSNYLGISYQNFKSVTRTTGIWIHEWLCYTVIVAENNLKYFIQNVIYGIQCIGYSILDLLNVCGEAVLNLHDILTNQIPGDFFFGLLLGICLLSLILLVIKLLDQKGFSLPTLQIVSISDTQSYVPDDDIVVSDEEDITLDEMNDTEPITIIDESSSSDEESDDEFSDDGEVEEFEVITDSSEDTSEENNENDQNRINIQLPERTGRYSLRSTPVLCGGSKNVSPDELQKKLETEQEKKLCVVCQDLPKCVLVLPCRHMCMCVECAHEMVNQRNRQRRNCPLCRTAIKTVMNVYV